MVVFKKRDSVPSARYSSVCNVLRQWRIWLIPTYRVYRLYDIPSECIYTVGIYIHLGDIIYSAGHQESRKCIFSLNVHFLSDTSCY